MNDQQRLQLDYLIEDTSLIRDHVEDVLNQELRDLEATPESLRGSAQSRHMVAAVKNLAAVLFMLDGAQSAMETAKAPMDMGPLQ